MCGTLPSHKLFEISLTWLTMNEQPRRVRVWAQVSRVIIWACFHQYHPSIPLFFPRVFYPIFSTLLFLFFDSNLSRVVHRVVRQESSTESHLSRVIYRKWFTESNQSRPHRKSSIESDQSKVVHRESSTGNHLSRVIYRLYLLRVLHSELSSKSDPSRVIHRESCIESQPWRVIHRESSIEDVVHRESYIKVVRWE